MSEFHYEGSLAAMMPVGVAGRSVSESAWQQTGEDSLEGLDGDVIELPNWAPGHLLSVEGSSPWEYDLDVRFWDAERTVRSISGCVSSKSDPQCLVPTGASYAAVLANFGASISFSLDIESSDCKGAPSLNPHYLRPEVGYRGAAAVVAVIDTGTNLFHNEFKIDEHVDYGDVPLRAIDAQSGVAARYLPIQQRGPVDCTNWIQSVIQPKTLYRAAGTNLFFITMHDELDGYDRWGHGTKVAGTIARNAPDVLIVSIQALDITEVIEAIKWASDQPWIDVVNSTWASGGSFVSSSEFASASRQVTDAGKLFVNSAGNGPTLYEWAEHAGPPWVIAVGGADPRQRGEAWFAAKRPDVVGDFTVKAPVATGYRGRVWASGTSFSAPTVAGTLGQAIFLARQNVGQTGFSAGGHLVDAAGYQADASDFRHSMNRNALYWSPTDYDPTATPPYQPGFDYAAAPAIPINPVAPWLQMGWGYVNGDLSEAIAEGALGRSLPEKPTAAVDYMSAGQAFREALWGPCGGSCAE